MGTHEAFWIDESKSECLPSEACDDIPDHGVTVADTQRDSILLTGRNSSPERVNISSVEIAEEQAIEGRHDLERTQR